MLGKERCRQSSFCKDEALTCGQHLQRDLNPAVDLDDRRCLAANRACNLSLASSSSGPSLVPAASTPPSTPTMACPVLTHCMAFTSAAACPVLMQQLVHPLALAGGERRWPRAASPRAAPPDPYALDGQAPIR
eukprot:1150885-Rhodomonas_salina.1